MSYRFLALTGNDINVGENFTMRFTVANQGPNPSPVNNPVVVFNNARIIVEATQFATPVAGNSVSLAVPDAQLFPGELSSVDVPMRALQNIGGIADWFSAEHVANAWAFADVDLPQYFRIWQFISKQDPGRSPSSRERQLEAENEKLKAKIGDLVMQIQHVKKCRLGFSGREAPIHP